jgi:outer membrane protein assembly factor BamB
MKLTGLTIGLALAIIATAHANDAKQIVKEAGVTGGFVVHVGCGDGKLTTALRVNDSLVVHGLDTDVTKARETIHAAGLYGPVSAVPWDGGALPYADNLARLVVSVKPDRVPRKEILRVLCPGGVAMIGGEKIVKPWPDRLDEWPQHFHGADNNAVSTDRVVGPPRRTQWIAEPQWSRAHLVLPSIHSMISAKGRLFSIEDQASVEHPALPGKFTLVCRDAFNGVVLWENRFPDWHPVNVYIKFTPAQLQRQLAVIGDTVYVTPGLDAPITVLDAVTGKKLRTYPDTERTQEFAYDGGVLYTVIGNPFDTHGISAHRGGTIADSAFPSRAYGPEIQKLESPQAEIVAIDADSGKTLWRVSGDKIRNYEGTSLAVRGPVAAYCTDKELVCLDRKTGAERWRVPAEVGYGGKNPKFTGAPGYSVALVLSDDAVYLAAGKTLKAYELKDGSQRWTAPTFLNHFKSPDLFLAAGAVWTARKMAYDPATGKLVRELPQKMTGPMGHDRCYRHRITERWYINTSTGGSDFLALDGSGEYPHPWVRSTCGIGHLPCNGLLYVGPPACSCCNSSQLNAFNALAAEPSLKSPGEPVAVKVNPQLEKGPAYGKLIPDSRPPTPSWPTYRCDAERSGRTRAAVSPDLVPLWSVKLSTRGSAPVIAGGMVFIADVDAHAVCALDAANGHERWRFVTGGRVDSPPTYFDGLLLFGSHDGRVYAVRAADGVLAWSFRALPERLICAYEQPESVWPVCGSILVKNGIAYFSAGRNSFLDGGVFLFGLDPATGRVVHQQRLAGPYGEGGFPRIADRKVTGGMGLEGHKGGVMLADDTLLYLRHQAFKPDLTPVPAIELKTPHLITSHGFVEATPHHRSFWTLDTTIRYDIPTGAGPVHGDILVKDGARFYEVRGYKPGRAGSFDPRIAGYTLFAGEISAEAPAPAAPKPKPAKARKTAKKVRKPKLRRPFTSSERWSVSIPLTGKAMLLTGNVLFVAGTPAVFPKNDLAKAYEGRMGGVMWAVSTKDGNRLAEYKLEVPPVWDSLAAVNGRLLLCTTDGSIHCYAEKTASR